MIQNYEIYLIPAKEKKLDSILHGYYPRDNMILFILLLFRQLLKLIPDQKNYLNLL